MCHLRTRSIAGTLAPLLERRGASGRPDRWADAELRDAGRPAAVCAARLGRVVGGEQPRRRRRGPRRGHRARPLRRSGLWPSVRRDRAADHLRTVRHRWRGTPQTALARTLTPFCKPCSDVLAAQMRRLGVRSAWAPRAAAQCARDPGHWRRRALRLRRLLQHLPTGVCRYILRRTPTRPRKWRASADRSLLLIPFTMCHVQRRRRR